MTKTSFFKIITLIFLGFHLNVDMTWAQRSPIQTLLYENHVYLPEIKSVKFHGLEDEKSLPILNLGETGVLELSFDDLRGSFRNYYISIEHCTSDWKPSNLTSLEYSDRFNEDRIIEYENSHNTFQSYTHYKIQFPTKNTQPTKAGNYLLKVYEDADKRRLILTQKFYVLSEKAQVVTDFIPSHIDAQKQQKLNLQLLTHNFDFNNPIQEVKIHVKQNNRDDVMEVLREPSSIQPRKLEYKLPKTLNFGGGNEFRYIDIRSLKLASERVSSINIDEITQIELFTDLDRSTQSYAETFDENGRFYIRNSDLMEDELQTDYAWVNFNFKTSDNLPLSNGQRMFVMGHFNHFKIDPIYELKWDEQQKKYTAPILLKQGVYDYIYKITDRNLKNLNSTVEGNYFQTENEYHIFVYYKKPGTTWEELISYHLINTR